VRRGSNAHWHARVLIPIMLVSIRRRHTTVAIKLTLKRRGSSVESHSRPRRGRRHRRHLSRAFGQHRYSICTTAFEQAANASIVAPNLDKDIEAAVPVRTVAFPEDARLSAAGYEHITKEKSGPENISSVTSTSPSAHYPFTR
jgi:hypothetical protein